MKSKIPSYEGSPKDIREDKIGAKKLGIGLKAYEKTARDKAQDRAGMKRMVLKSPGRRGR